MCAHTTGDNGSADFSTRLLALREGRTHSDAEGYINVGTLFSVVDTHQQLRDAVFPHLNANYCDIEWLTERAVLAPKNTTVTSINEQLLQCIPGDDYIYKSIDRTPDPENLTDYLVELLNSLEPARPLCFCVTWFLRNIAMVVQLICTIPPTTLCSYFKRRFNRLKPQCWSIGNKF